MLLWQYVRVIDPHQVQAALMKVGAGFGWIILSTTVAYALGTLGWWYCLGDAKAVIPKTDLFMIRHVSETVGLFNPASFAGGDMLKIVLLRPYSLALSGTHLKPLTPSTTMSLLPPPSAIMGTKPDAIASSTTFPNVSDMDGKIKTEADA